MANLVPVSSFIARFNSSPLADWTHRDPWMITAESVPIVLHLLDTLPEGDYRRNGPVAVHRTAIVESGAILKPPVIVGAQSFIAAGAYLRDGVWLQESCIVGSGGELKSSFVFAGSRLAHFNFVGDSLIGAGVNLEAGSIIANTRNERPEAEIRFRLGATLHGTGVVKFGAIVGDGARIGANAVIAPGALIEPRQIVPRLALVDQEMERK